MASRATGRDGQVGKNHTGLLICTLFQFGPGEPIRSLRGRRYNVGINGRNEILTVAEVDAELPGLCGPDDLAMWHMKLDFTDGTLETYGNKGQLHASDTGHLC